MTETEGRSLWPAPAKLNLFLRVVGRRADGYHRLQTYFQLLDWGDSLRIDLRSDGRIVRLQGAAGVAEKDDLCVRAAELLAGQSELPLPGVEISLVKRIPLGGGLGGGSSDAASVLVALNAMWRIDLSVDALAALALRLGADIPVFVRGHSAFAENLGEVLTPLALPPRWYVVIDPQISVPTSELFQARELTRDAPPTTIADFLADGAAGNAFEPVVRARYPQVAKAMAWLSQWGAAGLSGSGGCVFAAMPDAETALTVSQRCPPEFTAHVAQGLYESPLLAALARWRQAQ